MQPLSHRRFRRVPGKLLVEANKQSKFCCYLQLVHTYSLCIPTPHSKTCTVDIENGLDTLSTSQNIPSTGSISSSTKFVSFTRNKRTSQYTICTEE
jgi:hypothetical protein